MCSSHRLDFDLVLFISYIFLLRSVFLVFISELLWYREKDDGACSSHVIHGIEKLTFDFLTSECKHT